MSEGEVEIVFLSVRPWFKIAFITAHDPKLLFITAPDPKLLSGNDEQWIVAKLATRYSPPKWTHKSLYCQKKLLIYLLSMPYKFVFVFVCFFQRWCFDSFKYWCKIFIAWVFKLSGPISLKFQNNRRFMREIRHRQDIWDSIFLSSEVFTTKTKSSCLTCELITYLGVLKLAENLWTFFLSKDFFQHFSLSPLSSQAKGILVLFVTCSLIVLSSENRREIGKNVGKKSSKVLSRRRP